MPRKGKGFQKDTVLGITFVPPDSSKIGAKLRSIGERGDIVVFHYPRDPSKSYIKRLIGVPGDRVRVAAVRVLLNGTLIDEPYVPKQYWDFRSYPEVVVPLGAYYVLGDHRLMSN